MSSVLGTHCSAIVHSYDSLLMTLIALSLLSLVVLLQHRRNIINVRSIHNATITATFE